MMWFVLSAAWLAATLLLLSLAAAAARGDRQLAAHRARRADRRRVWLPPSAGRF